MMLNIREHTVKIKARQVIAADTVSVTLEKPTDFVFKAGQFLYLTIINPTETDKRGNARAFSIGSAPYEPDLTIIMRTGSSAFKNNLLKNLPIGSSVLIKGPMGHMTIPENITGPVVFIAGGIGISPLRSMLLDEIQKGLKHKIYLFYSNKHKNEAAFFEEFSKIKQPSFIFIPTLTREEPSALGHGEQGRIDLHMLQKYLHNLQQPKYYIVGLPHMVKDIKQLLTKTNVKEENIEVELFGGYE